MDSLMQFGYNLLDKGAIPDFILRRVVRALSEQRLREINHGSLEANHEAKMRWIEKVRARTIIADETKKANEQHYEVSTEFMKLCVGPRMKYSSCLYPTGKESIAQAEGLMLESYCEKAKLCDGIDILDLGCGWGSLSLFLAEKYPDARIVGLSNSSTQKTYIDSVAKEKGFKNLTIITGDVNVYNFGENMRFDRVLSIEVGDQLAARNNRHLSILLDVRAYEKLRSFNE
ncbi:hypothetical protein FRC12_023358 [Ceratobasidium sp. 428]|nr:hypothetical protein FRC12_023358 [Ceratobasidium sp. 428]